MKDGRRFLDQDAGEDGGSIGGGSGTHQINREIEKWWLWL